MKRKLDDWLAGYLKYTANTESPTSYHVWTGISILCAALQRKVYIRWPHEVIYPNEYIILVGPSGKSRKGTAINIGRWFIDKLGIPLIAEDNTPEVIIQDIKRSATTFKDATNGKITIQCAVSCFAEELSVFTGYQNSEFLAYLTTWYDSRDKWKRRTKHQGTDEIMGMCFNLCAATAPDWLPHILPKEAVGGGFTSRCLFIVEEGKGKIVADPFKHPVDIRLRDALTYDLEIINTLTGEATFTDDALAHYMDWYTREEQEFQAGNHRMCDPLFSGYFSRRATHIRKLCMVLSAATNDSRKIGKSHLEKGIQLLETAEIRMKRVYTGLGKSRYAEETDAILDLFRERKTITRSELMSMFYRNLDGMGLDIVLQILSNMGVVKTTRISGEDSEYKYVGGNDE